MTSVLLQRWRSRQLVGDSQHVLIARIRPGHFVRAYLNRNRIDNGQPIYPPLIWEGHNQTPWIAEWVALGNWVTLPSVESAKWTKDFDVQTGASKGTSTLTVIMDNIAFPEATGVAGLYHVIDRGHYSPSRGFTAAGRPQIWHDQANAWKDVLNGGYQIELWEGYGSGTDVELLPSMDPATHSFAPASGALARTYTGIVVSCDPEAHPDKVTLSARDFGLVFTDQRLMGWNKAREIRSPVTFADRKWTLGETRLDGPVNASSGTFNMDGEWTSAAHTAPDVVEWIEMTLPKGYYTEFFVAPEYDGMEMFVSLWMSDSSGVMDDHTDLPAGWVTLSGAGTGTTPDGTPYMRRIGTLAETPAKRWQLGHGFQVPDGSKLRLSFSRLARVKTTSGVYRYFAGTHSFYVYKYGTNPTGVEQHAKHWVLVDDAADVMRALCVWGGFKEWVIDNFGWSLHFPLQFGEDSFYMDVVTKLLEQGNFIFHMGAPTNDDRSIGVPHFEHQRVLDQPPRDILDIRDTDMTEALQTKYDLSTLPYVIRYRGAVNKKGSVLFQDLVRRFMATYFPSWSAGWQAPLRNIATSTFEAEVSLERTAGIVRHFTETIGLNALYALNSDAECLFACVLAAIQYALNFATAQAQIPGVAPVNLNTQISVADEASAVNSRLWVASIESDHQLGPSGKWTMTLGGSLIDTQEMQILRDDYIYAYELAQREKAA